MANFVINSWRELRKRTCYRIGKHIHPLETGGDTLHHLTGGKVTESFDHSDGQKYKHSEKTVFKKLKKLSSVQQIKTIKPSREEPKVEELRLDINHAQQ